jgi:hypothetical protein
MKRIGFWIAMMALLCSCRPAKPSGSAPGVRDILDLFDSVDHHAAAPGTSGSIERHANVTRGGRLREALVLVAPVTVRADLAAITGRYLLTLQASPVFNIGDGMQMDVWMESAGNRRKVLQRYFDAGRSLADRHWVSLEIALDLSGVPAQYIEIQVTGGRKGIW